MARVMRYLIVNADDFGHSEGINRGIIEAHKNGIVTSASLMVNTRLAEAAVALSRQHQELSLGLHVNFTGEGERIVDLKDLQAVRTELERQFQGFVDLTGRLPTHIDSHHHVHREFNIGHFFIELSRRNGLPLRGYSQVVYVGRFYGQSEYGEPDERYISVDFLIHLLEATTPGFTEISCHPGYVTDGFTSVYHHEREIELRSLTDPRVRAAIEEYGIKPITYQEYLELSRHT